MKADEIYAANNWSEILMYTGHSYINHAVRFNGIKCGVVGNLHTDLKVK